MGLLGLVVRSVAPWLLVEYDAFDRDRCVYRTLRCCGARPRVRSERTIHRAPTNVFEPKRYSKVKLDLNMNNYPWVAGTAEAPSNSTYLMLFLGTQTTFDGPGKLNVSDSDKLILYEAVTKNVRIRMDFLKVYTTDGVDHYAPQNEIDDRYSNMLIPGAVQVPIPAIISVCQGSHPIEPRFATFTYDPSLDALFVAPQAPSSPASNSKSKKPLHPAAYAVPIAVIAAIIVAGTIYAFVIRPRMISKSVSVSRASITSVDA